jgi:hypothetical protein
MIKGKFQGLIQKVEANRFNICNQLKLEVLKFNQVKNND